jgi:hypothetical protein
VIEWETAIYEERRETLPPVPQHSGIDPLTPDGQFTSPDTFPPFFWFQHVMCQDTARKPGATAKTSRSIYPPDRAAQRYSASMASQRSSRSSASS